MESIGLIITKFSDELIAAQFAAMCISLSLAIYWMLIRKKKRETSEWVSAALVRAYLDRVRAEEREIRIKLFGEDSGAHGAIMTTPMQMMSGGSSQEADALRAQLMMADQKMRDLEKMLAAMNGEKAALEQKVKNAPAAGPANNAANDAALAALKQQISELQAKLDEYGVIEDDLANLKKIQKENEQLKLQVGGKPAGGAQLSVVQGGAAPAPVAAAPAPTPAPVAAAPTPAPSAATTAEVEAAQSVANDSLAEKMVAELSAAPVVSTAGMLSQEGVDDLFNQLSASLAPTAGAAPAAAPTPAAAKPAPAPAAPAAAAPAGDNKAKEDELLSEFEKMLAS